MRLLRFFFYIFFGTKVCENQCVSDTHRSAQFRPAAHRNARDGAAWSPGEAEPVYQTLADKPCGAKEINHIKQSLYFPIFGIVHNT